MAPEAAGSGVGTHTVVAVQASDSIVGIGAVAYLRGQPGMRPVPASRAASADVVLVLADQITEETLTWMRRTGERAVNRKPRFVLVANEVPMPQLLHAVAGGLVSLLPREGCDYRQIVRAIQHVQQGRVELPAAALGSLIETSLGISQPAHPLDVAVSLGSTDSTDNSGRLRGSAALRLEERELDVLRLLADGLDTNEIAQRLNYSERTIKNIIHIMLNRMSLRNRPHAVAFALRNGLLLNSLRRLFLYSVPGGPDKTSYHLIH